MFSVEREALPDDSLLKTYQGPLHPERWGGYGDCFAVTAPGKVDLAAFVYAFYASPLFRIEGLILRTLLGASSSKAEARGLANGARGKFAVWYVGERTPTQLLMCDRYERTRSWFCVAPVAGGDTRLLFGSAVAAKRDKTQVSPLRGAFRFLLWFHVLYSQMLLRAARSNL
ncbi:MAG TPA: hypothetical protein VGD63_20420 [Steroidobacteraceae bacterium]